MASIALKCMTAPNPQRSTVFFTRFPKEIREQIFDLALTPFEKRDPFLPEGLAYSRPGFRSNHGRISTALLRTCQCIYDETRDIPARNYIKTDWYFNTGSHGHGANDASSSSLMFPSKMQSLHVYTTSSNLIATRCEIFWPRYLNQVAAQAFSLRYLKMTLGHLESMWMSDSDRPSLPEPVHAREPENQFSWGWHLRVLKNLMILEVEAETIIERMDELDEAVAGASNWRFPVASDKELVLNPQKTKKEAEPRYVYDAALGVGRYFCQCCTTKLAPPPDVIEAEETLIKAGASFVRPSDSEDQTSSNRLTFYAVTLVFEAKQVHQQHLRTS